MSKPNLFAVLGGVAVMALALIAPEAASAQTRGQRRPAAEAVAATPAENIAAAQAAATAAGISCQVTEANLLGTATGGAGNLYEAACATGPGYLITASTPPQVVDCVLLAHQIAKDAAAAPAEAAPARRGRRSEPETKSVSCTLPANQDLLGVQAAYAREAGIACQVDAATPIGVAPSGATVYEIGCAGVDGYRINKEAAGWTKVECLKLMAANGTCAYTTTAEQSATIQALLVSTAADDCVVEQARYLGGNANGEFYEAKCGADTGYILRVKAGVTEQVYPCASAQQIGGGCKLTVVPATAPATAPSTR